MLDTRPSLTFFLQVKKAERGLETRLSLPYNTPIRIAHAAVWYTIFTHTDLEWSWLSALLVSQECYCWQMELL